MSETAEPPKDAAPETASGSAPAPAPAEAAATAEAEEASERTSERRVRIEDLRASARTPEELAKIIALEAQVKTKRGKKITVVRAPAAPAVSPTPSPAPTPAPTPTPAPAPAPAPSPSPSPTPSPSPAPTPSPSPAAAARVAAPAPAPKPAAPSAPTVRARAPESSRRVPEIAIAATILGLLGLLASSRIERALGSLEATIRESAVATPTARDDAPARPAPVATAPVAAPGATPAIAPLADGRALVAQPDGRLVLMKRDPATGELEIERVYKLEDERPDGLEEPRRPLHGVRLADVEIGRKLALEDAELVFNTELESAKARPDGLERTLEAARRLADASGVDRLVGHLGGSDRIAARSAAIALGERGYIVALPELAKVLQDTNDPILARKIAVMLRDLTKLDLPLDERATAVGRAMTWWDHEGSKLDRRTRRVRAP
jgi:hypothetical protein